MAWKTATEWSTYSHLDSFRFPTEGIVFTHIRPFLAYFISTAQEPLSDPHVEHYLNTMPRTKTAPVQERLATHEIYQNIEYLSSVERSPVAVALVEPVIEPPIERVAPFVSPVDTEHEQQRQNRSVRDLVRIFNRRT